MPLFRLSKRLDFPPPWLSRSDGLLCVGGDLSTKRLLLAYKTGIFPWFSQSEPILWWSPDPRLVLLPKEINISKSLKKTIKKKVFTIKLDTDFEQTIKSCAKPRSSEEAGTWLVEEMVEAYIELHHQGHAHSVEAWKENRLVGGLYGVCIGGTFFGESMFSFEDNASKVALVALSRHLEKHNFDLIDCQVTTDHLLRMGAKEIPRSRFLEIISLSVQRKHQQDLWSGPLDYTLPDHILSVNKPDHTEIP